MKIVLTVLYVIACLGLILTVLFQDEKSAGLGSIGGGSTSFGKRSMDEKLSRLTQIFAIAFLVLSILMILFVS